MRLVPCPCPSGPLDPAPLSALCPASDAEVAVDGAVAYAAFWAADDGYYVRRTAGGETSWLTGDADVDGLAPAPAGERTRRTGAHAAVRAADAPAPRASGRWQVMLVGRQQGRRRTRVPMHLCVRRVRPSP